MGKCLYYAILFDFGGVLADEGFKHGLQLYDIDILSKDKTGALPALFISLAIALFL